MGQAGGSVLWGGHGRHGVIGPHANRSLDMGSQDVYTIKLHSKQETSTLRVQMGGESLLERKKH
jgi:hypothetical protein